MYVCIYCKPTTTDTTVYSDWTYIRSLHACTQYQTSDTTVKRMAYRELRTIIQKAENKGFPRNTIIKLDNKIRHQKQKINSAELNTD